MEADYSIPTREKSKLQIILQSHDTTKLEDQVLKKTEISTQVA